MPKKKRVAKPDLPTFPEFPGFQKSKQVKKQETKLKEIPNFEKFMPKPTKIKKAPKLSLFSKKKKFEFPKKAVKLEKPRELPELKPKEHHGLFGLFSKKPEKKVKLDLSKTKDIKPGQIKQPDKLLKNIQSKIVIHEENFKNISADLERQADLLDEINKKIDKIKPSGKSKDVFDDDMMEAKLLELTKDVQSIKKSGKEIHHVADGDTLQEVSRVAKEIRDLDDKFDNLGKEFNTLKHRKFVAEKKPFIPDKKLFDNLDNVQKDLSDMHIKLNNMSNDIRGLKNSQSHSDTTDLLLTTNQLMKDVDSLKQAFEGSKKVQVSLKEELLRQNKKIAELINFLNK